MGIKNIFKIYKTKNVKSKKKTGGRVLERHVRQMKKKKTGKNVTILIFVSKKDPPKKLDSPKKNGKWSLRVRSMILMGRWTDGRFTRASVLLS